MAPSTKLMYGVRLPYDRLKKLLNQLLEKELIEEVKKMIIPIIG